MKQNIEKLANSLVKAGVKTAFGLTGSGDSLDLITALDERDVPYYPVAHEASAAIMAGTVSDLTRSPAVSISIKGPGLTNMIPGIASNHLESIPAISISEAFGPDDPPHKMHKRMDHDALLSGVVKAAASLNQIERDLPELVDISRREIPGPVHIHLRENKSPPFLQTWEDTKSTESNHEPEQDDFRKILNQIQQADRPLVIAGSLSKRREWGTSLESLSVPVFTTVAAKGRVDERSSHAAGIFTGVGKELSPERQLLSEADLVIGLGLRNTEVIVPSVFDAPSIFLDEVKLKETSSGFSPDYTYLISSSNGSVNQVLEVLASFNWGEHLVEQAREHLFSDLLRESWAPVHVYQILNELDHPLTLVQDTGNFCIVGEHTWFAGPDRTYVGSNCGRYMGTGIPMAIGAAITNRNKPVFCITGDGGMRMYVSEMKLALRENLPICLILMRDDRYGSIAKATQDKNRLERAIKIDHPAWHESLQGMGIPSTLIDGPSKFQSEIENWTQEEPLFLELPFDSNLYENMVSGIR